MGGLRQACTTRSGHGTVPDDTATRMGAGAALWRRSWFRYCFDGGGLDGTASILMLQASAYSALTA